MEAIVAVYSDWGIGDGTTQPVVLKADRARFVELTRGAAVIVGRKTLGDFPGGRPLKGRTNIVMTRQEIEIEGALIAHDTREALRLAEQFDRCVVLGGASVFVKLLPYTDTVYVTKIDCDPGSSVFFPNLDEDEGWTCEKGELNFEGPIGYRFCTYRRIR